MNNIFHFSIIAAIVALLVSLNTNAYGGNSGNPTIIANIEQHDTEVKTYISDHDSNLGTHDTDVKTKLDEILAAVQNGGGAVAPVEKTGQTTSFEPGDDGELERGVPWPNPRFTDNLDGTITDNLTCLIWDQDANRPNEEQTWANAVETCDKSTANGHDDWRLPNVRELQSLIHYGVANPAVPDTLGTEKWSEDDPFNNVQSSFYWSSTTDASNTPLVWLVGFFNGNVVISVKTGSKYVWCVRGGP